MQLLLAQPEEVYGADAHPALFHQGVSNPPSKPAAGAEAGADKWRLASHKVRKERPEESVSTSGKRMKSDFMSMRVRNSSAGMLAALNLVSKSFSTRSGTELAMRPAGRKAWK